MFHGPYIVVPLLPVVQCIFVIIFTWKARHESTQERRKAKSLMVQERFIKRQFYLP